MVKYNYDAWGNCNVIATDSYITLANLNPYRYRSYYFDTETGLYFLKTRYYDPQVGRFVSIDNISYVDFDNINGINLYAYCGNNPVMDIDPDGTWSWKRFFKKTLITVGIAVAAIGAIALTVVTLGTAAPVLAAGIIGGIVAFSASVITQGIDNGYNKIDWGQTIIDTVSGIGYGVVSMLAPGVGGMFIKAGITSVNVMAVSKHQGGSFKESFLDGGMAFATSLAIQGALKLPFVNKLMDKLNFSHLFGKGRWVDFVSDKVNYTDLKVLDFGNLIGRELTIGATKFGSMLFSWIKNKIF